jgi:hypothetical protein
LQSLPPKLAEIPAEAYYGMNRGIYTGAKGMMTTTQWMDVVSNNLANSGTDGYKADSLAFSDVMVKRLYGNGGNGPLIGTLGNGPEIVSNSVDRSVGTIKPTGNPTDVAIRTPQGMFAVQQIGNVAYTRNGSFTINSDRELVTKQGFPVLSDQGEKITIPGTERVEIDAEGQVHQGNSVVANLGIFDGDFVKAGNSLWTSKDAKPMQNPSLATAAVESSNVEAVSAMVDLIKIQRSFEMSQKSIQTQDEMTGKLFEILNRR